jgi:ketosteroid isomerase-like protein
MPMLKALTWIITLIAAVSCVAAQSDLQKVVDTEHAFAQLAADKGTKAAFLANMTDDALVFVPDKSNAKASYIARPDGTPGVPLLSWAPNYADISANGAMGYTTGNWEFRPKGKSDQPSGYGDFITVWLRQPDGTYRWVIDIGITHEKPAAYSNEWVTSAVTTRDANAGRSSAADVAANFLNTATHNSAKKAYEEFAASDIRLYREGKLPVLGKKAAIAQVASEKGSLDLNSRTSFYGSADLAYSLSTYSRKLDGKEVEKGNYMQIWKLVGGKWLIVLDIFKAIPQK